MINSFSRILLLVIFPATLVIAGGILYNARTIQKETLADLIHYRTEQTAARLNQFLGPVATNLMMMSKWGQAGDLNYEEAAALKDRLTAVVDTHLPQISGLMFASTRGYEFKLLRDRGGWTTHVTDIPVRSDSALSAPSGHEAYDPRNRPWFTGALAAPAGQIHWTRVYSFYSKKVPGITASIRYAAPGEPTPAWVAAVDIVLDEFQQFVRGLSLGDEGKLFLTGNGKIAELSRVMDPPTPSGSNNSDFALPGNGNTGEFVLQAVAQWQAQGQKEFFPFTLKLNGRNWWVEFFPLSDDFRYTHLGILLPENVLLSEARQKSYSRLFRSLMILVGVVLAVIVLAAWLLSRRQRGGAAMTIHPDDPEGKLMTLIASGEGDRLEFKSTLRWNLKADKAGKEIELAALKTIVAFLNSEGGTLLVGVDDAGGILGVEADRFANDDKYLLHFNNLVKQHIGLEFSRCITFFLKPIGARRIMVVACRPSPAPVFLKHNAEEDFYVRVGPGSRKLPTSKAIEYIGKRKET